MTAWLRLGKIAWRFRSKLILSLLLAGGVAVLWCSEFLLTYPLVTVFIEGKNLEQFVQEQAEATRKRWDHYRQRLDAWEKLLADPTIHTSKKERLAWMHEQARVQRKLQAEGWRLWWWNWIHTRVVRLLPEQPFILLVYIFGLLIFITAAKGACCIGQDVLIGAVAERCVIELRARAFQRLLRWDVVEIEQSGSASLLSSLTFELQHLAHTLTMLTGRFVREPLKAVVCFLALCWLNWQLTCLMLTFIGSVMLLFYYLGKALRSAVSHWYEAMAKIYAFLEMTFQNHKLVLAYDLLTQWRRQFQLLNRDYFRSSMKIVKIDALAGPLTEWLTLAAMVTALVPGAFLLLRQTDSLLGIKLANHPLTLADLSTFYALLVGGLDPVRKFSRYFTLIKQSSSSLERTFALIDHPTPPSPAPPTECRPPKIRRLELRQVSLSVHDLGSKPRGQEWLLHDLSFCLQVGETVAIIGPNGSGKSTLLQALLGLYPLLKGHILVDGTDSRDIDPEWWRRMLAWVPQEPLLFEGSILDNIRYGSPLATLDEVQKAARLAHVTDFTDRWPQGLLTQIGGLGNQLSGGQRQRIAVARALLRRPQLLLLDEPTAAVDAESEHLILSTLASIRPHTTILWVTHHLPKEAIPLVDRVILMNAGTIEAIGSPEELSSSSPLYRQLVSTTEQLAPAA